MPFLILDLEMTGSEPGYHDIIQIGAVLTDNSWQKISEFETLVYPNDEDTISVYAEEVHGISIVDLKDAPMSHEALELMEQWLRKSLNRKENGRLNDIVLCGQSVVNDINFLKEEYSYLNMPWPYSHKMLDLLSFSFLFKRILKQNGIQEPKGQSLKAVAEFFDLSRDQAEHNALEDAQLTYKCFEEYLNLADKIQLEM